MKWFAISNTQLAAVFVCIISSSTIVEAQRPVAANRGKLQSKSNKAVDTKGKSAEKHAAVERYLRTVIGKERKARANQNAASKKNVQTQSAVERYLRTIIGKERKAHAKEIAALKKKIQTPSASERYLRTVIGKEREAHAKEIAALKKQLRKLNGNSK